MNPVKYITHTLVIGLLFSSSVLSDSVVKHLAVPYSKVMKPDFSIVRNNLCLRKSTVSQAQNGMRSGAVIYIDSGNSANPQWKFAGRDTIVYNADSKVTLNKMTNAPSGWATGNMMYTDSCIYQDGKLAEMISYEFKDGMIEYGKKCTFDFYNNMKCLVETDYEWDSVILNWMPVSKDSILFKVEIAVTGEDVVFESDMNYGDFTSGTFSSDYSYDNYQSTFSYLYDTISKQWKMDYLSALLDSGKTDTSLILYYKSEIGTANEAEYMATCIFSAGGYLYKYLTACLTKERNTGDAEYANLSKVKYCLTANSFGTCLNFYDPETGTYSNEPYYFYEYFFDSHGLDTLTTEWYKSTFASSDTIFTRKIRKYDSNGLNVETEKLIKDSLGVYIYVSKTVNSFTQDNVHVKFDKNNSAVQGIKISVSDGFLIINAQSITRATLYNVAGRTVAQKNQEKSNLLLIDLTKQNVTSSGIYFTKVNYNGTVDSFKIPIGN